MHPLGYASVKEYLDVDLNGYHPDKNKTENEDHWNVETLMRGHLIRNRLVRVRRALDDGNSTLRGHPRGNV